MEETNKELCDEINQKHMQDCEEEISRREHRAPKWNECGKIQGCAVATEKCEERYRSCYQSCGGTVQAERVCVLNCEAAPQK